jgi:polar amino acid transport system substrate-binding protein
MRYFLLLAIFLSLPRAGFSADEKPLEFYVVHYPPYEIIDISGDIYGIDVDVTKAAFTAVGIPIEVKTAPWKRILKNIEYGRIPGTITCSKRPGRELYMDYSDPISHAQQVVFSAVSTPVSSLNNFANIADYTVTVVDGWGIQKELDIAGIDHLPTVDVASGINAIVYRDVELFYNGYLTTQYQAKQMGLENQIKVSFLEDRGKTDFHVCFSKSYSDSRDLKQLFDKGLAIIKKNGVFDAIYQRYVHMELSRR